jgi:hypothetical protein
MGGTGEKSAESEVGVAAALVVDVGIGTEFVFVK